MVICPLWQSEYLNVPPKRAKHLLARRKEKEMEQNLSRRFEIGLHRAGARAPASSFLPYPS